MNYIKQMNAFWIWRKFQADISHSEADLYYALLNLANLTGWKTRLSLPNSTLMAAANIENKSQLSTLRNRLVQKGLIEYTPGRKGKAPIYIINKLYDDGAGIGAEIGSNKCTDEITNESTNEGTNETANQCTIYKNKINKNKIKENKKESKKEQKSYDDILNKHIKDEDLRDAYKEFIKMRQFIKKPMTDKALKTLIDKVNALEPESTERKIEMLNNAVLHNWLSVYPLDRGAGGNRQGAAEGSARNGESMQTNSQTSEWCTDKQWGGEQRSKFNNYEDTNKTDYAELEKILYEQMMRG